MPKASGAICPLPHLWPFCYNARSFFELGQWPARDWAWRFYKEKAGAQMPARFLPAEAQPEKCGVTGMLDRILLR